MAMNYPDAFTVTFSNDTPAPPLSNKYMFFPVLPEHQLTTCAYIEDPKTHLPEKEYAFLKWHFETMGGYNFNLSRAVPDQLPTIQQLINKGFFYWSDLRSNIYERTLRPTQLGRLAQLYHFTPNRHDRKPEYAQFESAAFNGGAEYVAHIDLILELDLGSGLVGYTVSKTNLRCIPTDGGVRITLEPIKSQIQTNQEETKPTTLEKVSTDMLFDLRELRVLALESSIEVLSAVVNEALEPLYARLTDEEKHVLAFASNVRNIPADLPQWLRTYYRFTPKELWDGKPLHGVSWKQRLPNLFALKLIETPPTSDSMYRLTKLGCLLLNGLPTEERSSPFLVARRMTEDERKCLLDFSWMMVLLSEEDAGLALVSCLERLRDLALVSDHAGSLSLTDHGREVVNYLLANRPDK
jgi:hypothetical protein